MTDINTNNNQPDLSGLSDSELFRVVEFRQEEAEKIAYSNYSYWRSTFKTFLRNKVAVLALAIMFSLIIFAFIQPFLPNQQNPYRSEYTRVFSMWKHPPTAKHWFGTDELGRDMWARVWEGSRISLKLSALVSAVDVTIGIIIGALWGYIRKIDRFMTELTNTINGIPSTILYTLMAYMLKPGFWTIALVMMAFGWMGMSRTMRNQVLIIRDREYNMASKCLGTPILRMVLRNLIPHLISVIIMRLALYIPSVISTELTLTFLNVGLPIETPSLGVLVNSGRSTFMVNPHLLFFPALIMGIITVSFYLVGNAFSDASDPRNHT